MLGALSPSAMPPIKIPPHPFQNVHAPAIHTPTALPTDLLQDGFSPPGFATCVGATTTRYLQGFWVVYQ